MLFDWSVNHRTLRTISLEIISSRHARERERERERVRETDIYEWMDGGWMNDLDTTGIFFVSDHNTF